MKKHSVPKSMWQLLWAKKMYLCCFLPAGNVVKISSDKSTNFVESTEQTPGLCRFQGRRTESVFVGEGKGIEKK